MPLPKNFERPNLHSLATQAIRFAREKLPLGSYNKRYDRPGPIPEEKREKHSQKRLEAIAEAMTNAKKHTPPFPCSEAQMLTYGREIIRYGGGGNCQQLTAAAYVFLKNNLPSDVTPKNIVMLTPRGNDPLKRDACNHAFVVLGQEPSKNGHYPPIATWPIDVVICDPYIGWSGFAYQFNHFVNEKAGKWDRRGMTITGVPPTTLLMDAVWNCDMIALIQS